MVTGCSSGSSVPDDPGGTIDNNPNGVIPENTDGGEHNTKAPDNVNTSGSGETTPTWKLVFDDEFEGKDSIPDTSKWSLAKKGDNTWSRYMSESYGQAYQKDGYLYLFGMLSNGEYKCGGIETIDKFSFIYGQVKCRAKFLRRPQGNHTGIWMMPEPPAEIWPRSGEIDVMEHLDDQSLVYETVHYYNEDKDEDASSDATVEINNEEFNEYGVIWDKDSVTFTVNGNVYFKYKNNDSDTEAFSYQYPFTKPFYLILSQSLGGRGTWEGVIDDSELPAVFQIDWIKVWQKTDE